MSELYDLLGSVPQDSTGDVTLVAGMTINGVNVLVVRGDAVTFGQGTRRWMVPLEHIAAFSWNEVDEVIGETA
jgi:hypothetical protein